MSQPDLDSDRDLEPFEGWGRQPKSRGRGLWSEDLERSSAASSLSRGWGRAYGDAALPASNAAAPLLVTTAADRILEFDATTGRVRVEAGVSIETLYRCLLRRGFFPPVVPGTRYVSIGGMVASDVHGKNHHVEGCFGEHVEALKIRVGDGRVLEATRKRHADLFRATIGGMGLTGHILEVTFKMARVPSPWIYEESTRYPNLSAVMAALEEAKEKWPMTVAWIDTSASGSAVGRGIVMCGRWATPEEAPSKFPAAKRSVAVPFDLPSGLVDRWSFNLLNRAWFAKHGSSQRSHVVHPESYFWPLDAIRHWNRAFGPRGFAQYQCVMPSSESAYRELLDCFREGGGGSFVSVFKDCGEGGIGTLSFPRKGTSLALDIPFHGAQTQALVDAMNAIVLKHGGRIYLAKDSLTQPEDFGHMYPELQEFSHVRRKYDPAGRIASAQSVRLLGDTPPQLVAAADKGNADPSAVGVGAVLPKVQGLPTPQVKAPPTKR